MGLRPGSNIKPLGVVLGRRLAAGGPVSSLRVGTTSPTFPSTREQAPTSALRRSISTTTVAREPSYRASAASLAGPVLGAPLKSAGVSAQEGSAPGRPGGAPGSCTPGCGDRSWSESALVGRLCRSAEHRARQAWRRSCGSGRATSVWLEFVLRIWYAGVRGGIALKFASSAFHGACEFASRTTGRNPGPKAYCGRLKYIGVGLYRQN